MSAKKQKLMLSLAGMALIAPTACVSIFGVFPFGGGVYIGCLLVGVPIYAILPIYVAVSLVANLSLAHIVEVLVFAVVGGLCAIPLFRRPYFFVPIYFIASLGCIYRLLFGDNATRALLGVALGAFAMFATLATAKQKSKSIGIGGLICMVGVGFHAVPIVAAAVAGVGIIWVVRRKLPDALAYLALYGVGGTLATGNYSLALGYLAVGATASLFARNKWTSILAFCTATTTYTFLLGASIYSALAMLGGALVGMFLPVKCQVAMQHTQVLMPVLRKMAVAAKACNELQMGLAYNEPDEQELSASLCARTCEGCSRVQECADTENAFLLTARRALATRRSGIDVLCDQLVEQCIRASDVPHHLTVLLRDYEHTIALNELRADATTLAAEEMKAFATLIEEWLCEAKASAVTDAEIYHEAQVSLGEKGATLESLRLYGGGVQVVARKARDEDILTALNRACVRPYVLDSVTVLEEDTAEYMLLPKPRFALVYGAAKASRETDSGDIYLVKKLNATTILAVLSDGMGSGRGARELSGRTMGLIEAYFAAGFDTHTVLKFVNSLLSLGGERFACVDLCLVDLERGEAHFIKVGGQISYVLKESERITVEGGALPLGTSRTVTPAVQTVPLSSGDVVVLMTDGITDTDAPVKERLASPQALADKVLLFALNADGGKPHDDMTVLALRVV